MIVSASYRTDIPAFYGRWFMNRLEAGFCRVMNPYGGAPSTVPLTREAVDGFVFWSRNLAPFLAQLDEVKRRGFPFILQMTVTSYPRALEVSVPAAAQATAQLRAVAERFGPRTTVWRYDPILLTSITETDWHVATFTRGVLCGLLCQDRHQPRGSRRAPRLQLARSRPRGEASAAAETG